MTSQICLRIERIFLNYYTNKKSLIYQQEILFIAELCEVYNTEIKGVKTAISNHRYYGGGYDFVKDLSFKCGVVEGSYENYLKFITIFLRCGLIDLLCMSNEQFIHLFNSNKFKGNGSDLPVIRIKKIQSEPGNYATLIRKVTYFFYDLGEYENELKEEEWKFEQNNKNRELNLRFSQAIEEMRRKAQW
jgi:hypothetical protein